MACLTINGVTIPAKDLKESRRILKDENTTIDNTLRTIVSGNRKRELQVTTRLLKKEDAENIIATVDGLNGASASVVYDQWSVNIVKCKVFLNDIDRGYYQNKNDGKILNLTIREV